MINGLGNTKLGFFGVTPTKSVTKNENAPSPSILNVGASPLWTWFASSQASKEVLPPLSTTLRTQNEVKMYNAVVSAFATSDKEKTSPIDNVSRQNKLEALLKNGTLLNNDSDDRTTVLHNIYKTIQSPRFKNMDGTKLAGQIIDAIYKPSTITQQFGDIPERAKYFLSNSTKQDIEKGSKVKQEGSITCAAASVEFCMARRQPAEFARWAENLTSPKVAVEKNIDLSSLSKNPMDAVELLKEFSAPVTSLNFHKAKLNLKPDKNAAYRALIQDYFWDKGERSVLDALIQPTLMQLGSGGQYDSLTDSLKTDMPGLIDYQKTFIESVVKNSERLSVPYLNCDYDRNVVGRNFSVEDTKNHVLASLDSGDDVILGYVTLAKDEGYKNLNPNQIVMAHEMTIVGYKQNEKGELMFICNDTDDSRDEFYEYPASKLLPKIHHAGYSAELHEQKMAA